MYIDIKGYTFPVDKALSYSKISELKTAIGNIRFHRLSFGALLIKEAILFTDTENTGLAVWAVKEGNDFYLSYKQGPKGKLYSLAARKEMYEGED